LQVTSPRDDSKPALRRILRASRPDPETQLAQSEAIRRHLREWLARRPSKTIAAFAAIPGEPMLLPLLADLPDHRWALPRVQGDALVFHHVTPPLARLQAGTFGVAEPSPDAPACPLEEIGIFLCPGMAFTHGGKRLGRGKGYYDRMLAGSPPESLRVGVCFREQVHPELPVEPHDLPVHFLATPDGVEECR
jgi:5-formyltetrahydrofolate cyclo-ligase